MCIRDSRQAGIVDLAADDGNAGTVRALGVRLALFELSRRLAQVGQDERLRAGVAHEVEDCLLYTSTLYPYILSDSLL